MVENQATGKMGEHAIVIGGSIAGLVTARVLANHFDRVTIVERDRFPDKPDFRKGVPQSRHLHGLLERGLVLLESFFPGFSAEITAAGAHVLEVPGDVLVHSPFGWYHRFRPGLKFLTCSRELLEWSVRRRLVAMNTIAILEEHEVIGLLANPEKTGVTGIQFRTRKDGTFSAPEELRGTFVADASGRHSRAPDWLHALSYPRPQEIIVNSLLGYASRYYEPPKDFQADWAFLFLQPNPPSMPRGGALMLIEGNRWLVTLSGAAKDYPPTDEAGFLDFSRSLRSPILYHVIKDAQPLSPISGYQDTDNRLHHYEKLGHWPEQFIVLGDAACAFNPIYGQGMTAAIQSAYVLDQVLREQRSHHPDGNLSGLSRRFQQRVSKVNATAWLLATGSDFSYPTTEGGRRSLFARFMHPYLQRVARTSTIDPYVGRALFSVTNLISPPLALFRPQVLLRVIRGSTKPTLDQPPTATIIGIQS